MARTRIRTVATVFIVAVVVAALAVGGFAGTRDYRKGHDASRVVTVTAPPPTPAAASTPAAIAGADRPPAATTTTPTAAAVAVPVPAKVAAALAPALAAPALGGSVHAYVADAATGRVLLNRGGTIASPPASTAKLATALATLATFPATARITTRAVAGLRPGQVVVVGAGDPTLSAARVGTPSIYAGAARLSTLAAQIKKALGATPVSSIVVDTSRFTGPRVAPSWAPEDVPSDYASAITSLMVDGGLPASGGSIRSAEPDLEAGRALAVLLGSPELPVTTGVAAAGARRLGAVSSAPMLDLVEQMLATSDNVIAEVLARQVAIATHRPASFAGAVEAVRTVLHAAGVAFPATMSDGSGLSAADRLTPATLVGMLRVALAGARPAFLQLFAALPVSGWAGTLAGRYRTPTSSAAAGRVRAKTGSLTGVVTLAGTVRDNSGRLLVFAIMTDQVGVYDTFVAEAAVDAVVARLSACGCR